MGVVVVVLIAQTELLSFIKEGTDLAYFKHIFAAGNLNYGKT